MLANIRTFLKRKSPPGPSIFRVINNQIYNPKIQDRFHIWFEQPMVLMEEYGDLIRIPNIPPFYITSNPEAIWYANKTNLSNYEKEGTTWENTRLLIGESTLGTSGEKWQQRRQVVSCGFQKHYLNQYSHQMNLIIQAYGKKWQQLAEQRQEIDVMAEMSTLTLRVIIETLTGQSPSDQETLFISEVIQYSLQSIAENKMISRYRWVPTYPNQKFHYYRRRFDRLIQGWITDYKSNKNSEKNCLFEILAAESCFGDNWLIEEIRSLLVAGHETTACALTWAWYLLALNPECYQKLREELQQVLGDRPATVQDIPKLKYTKAVIQETLRLYPSIPILFRRTKQADALNGFHIPEKSEVLLHIYALHRNPKYWQKPNSFIPERFLSKSQANIQTTYLPYANGPRTCLGVNFAQIETTLVLCQLARQFELSLDPDFKVTPIYGASLRPSRLPMKLETVGYFKEKMLA